MFSLALELSTSSGSIALADGTDMLAEESWDASGRASQRVFDALRTIEGKLGPPGFSALGRVVVGCGPGSYSGIRIGITVARSLALPFGTEVFALSSWSAPAGTLARHTNAATVCVVGDARRARFWFGMFDCGAGCALLRAPFELLAADQLVSHASMAVAILAADTTAANALSESGLSCSHASPCARELLEAASRQIQAGQTSDELVPIYVHPPVFVKPRFPSKTG